MHPFILFFLGGSKTPICCSWYQNYKSGCFLWHLWRMLQGRGDGHGCPSQALCQQTREQQSLNINLKESEGEKCAGFSGGHHSPIWERLQPLKALLQLMATTLRDLVAWVESTLGLIINIIISSRLVLLPLRCRSRSLGVYEWLGGKGEDGLGW